MFIFFRSQAYVLQKMLFLKKHRSISTIINLFVKDQVTNQKQQKIALRRYTKLLILQAL